MPELPEVESIKLQLNKYLVGHTIKNVEIRNPKSYQGDTKNVIGGKVLVVKRFAKVLSIDLTSGYSIVIHIKLTGQLIYRGPNLSKTRSLSDKVIGGLGGKHTHVIFSLDRGGILYFNDVRKFGWIKIVKTSEVTSTGLIGKLGPEPLNDLTLEKLKQILASSRRPIKLLLMDQSKIGGIGNIYANDALWLAKINPKTPAKNIQNRQLNLLFDSITDVLKTGLKFGGASEQSFVTPDGKEGKYQDHSLAYGKEGQLCKRCKKGKFEKFFLGSRGTYICPVCQKK